MTRAVRGGPLLAALPLALLVALAVLAPLLLPYDPAVPVGDSFQPPSFRHPLGTDNLGQDVLSRVIAGTRISLPTGIAVAGLAVATGTVMGAAAGLAGGRLDLVLMRIVDVIVALPRLPLLILIGAFTAASRLGLVFSMGLLAAAPVARVLRNQALALRHAGYLRAARGFGGGPGYLLRRHVAPALVPLLLAEAVTVASAAILLEAGLAFLGLADPAAVSWGLDLERALSEPGIYANPAWLWWVLPTGVAVVLCVGAFTAIGRSLEPSLWTPATRRWDSSSQASKSIDKSRGGGR